MKNRFAAIYILIVAAVLSNCVFAAATPPKSDPNYNLGKAEVVNSVILSVIENYYNPARIDSKRMFTVTMDTLQKAIAELKVQYDDTNNVAVVEVMDKSLTIEMDSINGPWHLSRRMRQVLRFLNDELPRGEYDLRELEYGAANAMLSSLDPHSNVLPPDLYESLRMDTAGEFGGLGIKITTDRRPPCKGNLTVVEVFEKTPADKAGLKAGDQIIRIDGESTVNITTSEAAQRLRGKPGSTVVVQIKKLSGQVRKLDIVRDTVSIESVIWKILPDGVGYISLEAFQGNSANEFEKALEELHDQKMKGLILDMRGNPGGLLDVAIKIADLFLDSGTIVTTAGRNEREHRVRNANAEGTEPQYPVVVLINSSSASAAEIIAGALRNHGRALLIGQTTFGKGSVQMVQPVPGGGALKLTSAQYLTPGDISIQAVGVAPDVTFVPVIVDSKEMDIEPNDHRFSEADLEHHLDRPTDRTRGDRPGAIESPLYIPAEEIRADKNKFERCFVDDSDRRPFRGRYEEEFARRLISSVEGTTAEELMIQAVKLLDKERGDQERTIGRSLSKLRIDWSAPPKEISENKVEQEPRVDSKVVANARVVGDIEPGRKVKIAVTVKNSSKETIYRLRGVTKSDNLWLDGLEFVFGKVKQGRSKSWNAVVDLPLTVAARVDPVAIEFEAEGGPLPPNVSVDLLVRERPEPRLAYGWHFEDLGNGNGVAEPGEELLMYLTAKNIGKGKALDVEANLSAKPGIDVIQGRFEIGELKEGEIANGVFRLRVVERFTAHSAELNLAIQDWIPAKVLLTRPLLNRRIELPIGPPAPRPGKAVGTITVTGEGKILLRDSPGSNSRPIATTTTDTVFTVDASEGGFFRVVLGRERHAWIKAADTLPGGRAKPKYNLILTESPTIVTKGKRVRRVLEDKVTVKGWVTHPVGVRDLMVFVGDSKVLYLPAKNGNLEARIDFDVDVPLDVGANRIVVVARHDDQVIASMPVFVRRDEKTSK